MINLKSELEGCFSSVTIRPDSSADSSGDSCTFELILPRCLTYFNGHFPGYPVLPAVGFVDISIFLAQIAFLKNVGDREMLLEVAGVKIKKPLSHSQPVLIHVKKRGHQSFEFDWENHSQISLRLSI